MISIRQRILEILEKQQAASASELSRSLGVSAANVRHHLRNLKQEGIVENIGKQPPQGRGRPSQIYGLVDDRGELLELTENLLNVLLSESTSDDQKAHLRELARRLAGHVPPSRAQLTQRLYQVVQRLNALHYRAHWEAHVQAPRIILGNCPYSQIIENHPELCQMDSFLIEQLSEEKVVQTKKLAKNKRGIPHCVFVVHEDI